MFILHKIVISVLTCFIIFAVSALSYGATYRKPLPALSSSFDPILFTHGSSLAIANQIYDRLFDIDELNKAKPKLVSEWSVNTDGVVYDICIRDNVVFHDGKKLTSDDIAFTLQRLLSKRSVMNSEFSIIKGAKEFQKGLQKSVSGIKIKSPTCFSIELEKPFPLFITMLAASKTEILPFQFHGVPEEVFFKQPVGTGPFKFSKSEPGKYIELVANDKYFLGAPKLKMLIYEQTDRVSAILGFNKGHYQDLEWFYPQLTELITNYSVIKVPISATNILAFNLKKSLYNNVHFRRAINFAINKKAIVDACIPGSTVANAYVPPGLAGYNKELPSYKYDPKLAMAELKKVNPSKESLTKQVTILRPDNYPCEELFTKLVEADIKAIGINVKVVHIPYAELIEKYYKPRSFEIINISFAADFSEALFMLNDFRSDSTMNYSGFSSLEVDKFLNLANTSSDRYERFQAYEKIQELLHENAVTDNLYYHMASIVLQPNVKGFTPSPLGTFYSSMWPVYIEEDEK